MLVFGTRKVLGTNGSNGAFSSGSPVMDKRTLAGAVVGDRTTDHLVLTGLAGELEVLLGQLPGGLDGLAATAGEEDPVEVARRVAGHALGQLDRLGMRVRPEREERQLRGLLGRRLGELGPPVAQLADEEAGQTVQVPLAAGIVDIHAVAADDDRHLAGLVARHPGEVHPQVIASRLLQVGEVGVVERVGRHRGVPSSQAGRCPPWCLEICVRASDFVPSEPIVCRCQQFSAASNAESVDWGGAARSRREVGGVDTLFVNGSVFDGSGTGPAWPWQSAPAGSRRSATDLSELRGPHTEVVDLAGGLLLPGFVDAHVHPVQGGLERARCDLAPASGLPAYQERIARYAAMHPERAVDPRRRLAPARLPRRRTGRGRPRRRRRATGRPSW